MSEEPVSLFWHQCFQIMVKIKKVKNKAFLMTPSLSKKLTGMMGCLFSQGANETKGVAASIRKLGISCFYCHQ